MTINLILINRQHFGRKWVSLKWVRMVKIDPGLVGRNAAKARIPTKYTTPWVL